MASKKAAPVEAKSETTTKATFYLPDTLVRRLRVRAAEGDDSQSDIVRKALEAYLTAKR